jgi:hypothetical protein
LLRNLDNTDKHSFILPIGENVIVGGVSLKADEPCSPVSASRKTTKT